MLKGLAFCKGCQYFCRLHGAHGWSVSLSIQSNLAAKSAVFPFMTGEKPTFQDIACITYRISISVVAILGLTVFIEWAFLHCVANCYKLVFLCSNCWVDPSFLPTHGPLLAIPCLKFFIGHVKAKSYYHIEHYGFEVRPPWGSQYPACIDGTSAMCCPSSEVNACSNARAIHFWVMVDQSYANIESCQWK